MSDSNFENELNEQELNRVSNALDALENHNQTPTTQGWEAIMDESQKRSQRASKRTTLISAAAALALIASVSTAIVLSTSNNEVKTVDQSKKETVSTSTIPLTEEQQLLKGGVTLYTDGTEPKLVDSLTGDEIPGFKEFVANSGIKQGAITSAGGNYLELRNTEKDYCDNADIHYFNFRTGDTAKINGEIYTRRVYSTSENIYAEFKSTCATNPELTDWRVTMTIVNTKTNEKTIVNPEPYDSVFEQDAFLNPTQIIWIDDNQALLGLSISTANGLDWGLVDLSKKISLNDSIKQDPIVPSSTNGLINTVDAKLVDGNILALITEVDDSQGYDKQKMNVIVRDITNGKDVWTKILPSKEGDYQRNMFLNDNAYLSNNGQVVYGLLYDGDVKVPFIYNHANDSLFKPSGTRIFRTN